MPKPLCYLTLTDEWIERLSQDLDHYRGGYAVLERKLQRAWIREGRGRYVPVDNYDVAKQIRQYAYDTEGTWQRRFRALETQLPRPLVPPQQEMFA